MVLKGKIVEIIDDYDVVVNLGYEDGVKKDMEFIVYKEGKDIVDPQTSKILGQLEILISRLKPVLIQEKITTMRSNDFKTESPFLGFFGDMQSKRVRIKLPLEGNIKRSNEELLIKINSLVREDVSK